MSDGATTPARFRPSALTGPILTKELRVSSRRRRYYALRFAYLLLLMLFIAFAWMEVVRPYAGGTTAQVARMAEAGRAITALITWFQFLTCQLLAVILLSTAVSDEVTHRTLGTLMTTPITGVQVVAGKLLSRLWQIILLLAISLPVLAVVRVFGGVPWDFMLGGVAVTVSTCLFLGAVSLWFSVFDRRSYTVIIKTVVTAGVLFLLLPWAFVMIMEELLYVSEDIWLPIVVNTNPYVGLAYMTAVLDDPYLAAGGGGPWFSWHLLCSVLLVGSAVVLAGCVTFVRRVGSRQACGETDWFSRRGRLVRLWRKAKPAPTTTRRIRPVRGRPMVWKELRTGGRNRRKAVVRSIIALVILLATYVLCAADDQLMHEEAHIVYMLVFFCIGVLGTTTIAGAAMGEEKESQTLPLLMVTNITACDIVFGKIVGVLRRSWLYWALGALHLALFTSAGAIWATSWLHYGIIVAGTVMFLTGTGLYFGSAFRRTVTAVIMNILLVIALWVVIPLMLFMASAGLDLDEETAEWCLGGTPWAQTIVVIDHGAGKARYPDWVDRDYYWPDGCKDAAQTSLRIVGWAIFHTCVGLFLMSRASARLRRRTS